MRSYRFSITVESSGITLRGDALASGMSVKDAERNLRAVLVRGGAGAAETLRIEPWPADIDQPEASPARHGKDDHDGCERALWEAQSKLQ